jgi:large subunit ribosomal protein L10
LLSKFIKDHPVINLLGGILEGSFISKNVVAKIASLPAKEILVGQFINVINVPMRQMVGVLQGPIRDFTLVLSELASKKRS